MNDDTSTPEEQIMMMVRRDGIDSDIRRWETNRNDHFKRIAEIDKDLSDADPERLQQATKLWKQIAMLSDTDHLLEEDDNEARDALVADELPFKHEEFTKLMEAGEHHLWSERLRKFEQVVHCTEEIERCKTEAERLDALIEPIKPDPNNIWTKENIDRSFAEMVEDDPSYFEDLRTDEQVQIDELEMQIMAMEENAEWNDMSAEREVRKQKEYIQALQLQDLEEYIDQLKGSKVDPNAQHFKEISLLDKQDVIGKTVNVYFTGDHQRKALALRYKEDLRRTHWKVKVESKTKNPNKYAVEYKGKTYQVGLVVDEKTNHIIAKTFMSKSHAWWQAYKSINGPSSYEQLTVHALFQWHDKVEAHLAEKKGQRNISSP